MKSAFLLLCLVAAAGSGAAQTEACGTLPEKPASACAPMHPACLCDARGACKWQWLCAAVPPTPAPPTSQVLPQPPRAVSVEDLVRLLRAGISQDLILTKIRAGGQTLNLSADDLVKLKQAGAGDEFLKALLSPGPQDSAAAAAAEPQLPTAAGVYWIDPESGPHRIEGVTLGNPRVQNELASRLTLGMKRARMYAQLDGPHASTRAGERRPRFYFYLPEGAHIADYVLVRLDEHEDARELEIGERSFWDDQFDINPAIRIDCTYQRLADRLYLVTPADDLIVGEYAFFAPSAAGLHTAARVYDFGIE